MFFLSCLLVFSWYTNNSTPRILLSRLSKKFATFPFRHNILDLFSSLIRATCPIFQFTFPLFGSYLFWFECLSNNANKYSWVNRLIKCCKIISVCFTFSHNSPHLWYRYPNIYYARNDHKSNGLVSNFLETDPRLSKSKDGNS